MGTGLSLLQMSFAGAVLVVIIAGLRTVLLNRLPKRTFLILWIVTIIRLLLPFAIPSRLSVYSLAARERVLGERIAESRVSSFLPVLYAQPSASGEKKPQRTAQTGLPDEAAPGMAADNNEAAVDAAGTQAALLWFAGFTSCAVFFAAAYVYGRREFRTAIPVTDEFVVGWLRERQRKKMCRVVSVCQSDRISAPLTYGVFRPVILIPKAANWEDKEQLRYILTHEYIHIRHFDVALKMIAAFTLCVHWFNPAVWILYILFNRDIELACDECAVRQLGLGLRADYALALINMEEKKSRLIPFGSSFSKTAIEERIVAIMKIKKVTALAGCMSAVLILGVVMTVGTSAADDTNKDIRNSAAEYDAETEKDTEGGTNYAAANAGIQGNADAGRMPEDILGVFEPFGISWKEAGAGRFNVYWEGQPVKVFLDMRPGGEIYLYPSCDEAGIYACSTYDEAGEPCGVLEYSQGNQGGIDGWLDIQIQQDIARQWADTLAPYTPFGLGWAFELGQDANGYKLTMHYQDREVRGIVDTNTGAWITDHAGGTAYGADAVELYTVYEDGILTGLRPATEKEQKEWDDIRQKASQAPVSEHGGHHTEHDHH